MSTEIELKLEVDPEDLAQVRREPLLANAESRSCRQLTIYYDTPETRLRKHGFTLRVRSVDGRFVQTVKPVTDSVGLLSREEVECEVGSIEPDLAALAGHPIHDVMRSRDADRLQPTIRSEVERTSWEIDRRNGRIRIDLDHGEIAAKERKTEFAELELELLEGPPASLIVAARRLADHIPLRLSVLTKADRGFLLARNELGNVQKSEPVAVDSGTNVGEAFETIVHACLKHYRLNEALVLGERAAGGLHQARVAMRRLRAALTLFRPAVEDVEFQHLRDELRWFTGQLGDARNLDVYLERNLGDDERAQLERKREQAYDLVIEAMNSPKFRRLLIDLVGWAAIGAWRRARPAKRPITGFANQRLDRLWRSVTDAGRDLGRMDEVTRHELRIQIKKLRYAIEFLRNLYGDARAAENRFAAAAEDLQESLGKLNDMETAKTLGASAGDDGWLIGSLGERRHLIAAEDALRELLRVGPFWEQAKDLATAGA